MSASEQRTSGGGRGGDRPVDRPEDRQSPAGRLRKEIERTKRCCRNCAYASRPCGRWFRLVLARWAILLCANSADAPGEIRAVPGCHTCPNFRASGERRPKAMVLNPHGPRVCKIPLTKGKVALVDAGDYVWLSKYRWFLSARKHGPYYAATHIAGKVVTMHRLIMNPPPGIWVHHKDDNGLNNCRDNLCLCTPAENARRRRHPRKGESSFIGVHRRKEVPDKWYAKIEAGRDRAYLGPFDTEIEAARARDAKAIEMHGEFARLNFPEGHEAGATPPEYRTQKPKDREGH